MILLLIPLLAVLALLLAWLWPPAPEEPMPIPKARPWPPRELKPRGKARPRLHWQGPPCSDIWAGERPTRADPFAPWYQENWDRDLIRGDAEEFDFGQFEEPAPELSTEDHARLRVARETIKARAARELRVELRAEFYRLAEDQTLRDQGLGVLAALVGVPLSTARGWWARGVARGFLKPYRRTALCRDNDKYQWTPREARRRFQ